LVLISSSLLGHFFPWVIFLSIVLEHNSLLFIDTFQVRWILKISGVLNYYCV
jgi:hypothetical protein